MVWLELSETRPANQPYIGAQISYVEILRGDTLKPSQALGGFGPIFKSALRGRGTKFFDFFFIGTFATKSFARSRIFRYGLSHDIWSKRQIKRMKYRFDIRNRSN